MSKVCIVASTVSSHQIDHANAIKSGLEKIGQSSTIVPTASHIPEDCDTVYVWGWRSGEVQFLKGRKVIVIERGYIGDRFTQTSLAMNGLNGYGHFPIYHDPKGERFNAMHPGALKPWRGFKGDYVLLIAQVPGDASLRGEDLTRWYSQQAKHAAESYRLPVVFREHPQAIKRGVNRTVPGTVKSIGSLEEDLSGAALVITYNSNTGVDAVIAGIPTIVCDQGSMAWNVRCASSAHEPGQPISDLEFIEPANREAWAYNLAWCQWTLEEIATGYPLQPFVNGV